MSAPCKLIKGDNAFTINYKEGYHDEVYPEIFDWEKIKSSAYYVKGDYNKIVAIKCRGGYKLFVRSKLVYYPN